MELEEETKILKNIKNSYIDILYKKEIRAIKTVLQELEYVKNGEQKAMEILKQNSIGRYKKEENGTISYIIAVEDFKKILNLIDTQEIELKNSIPKKKIEKLIDDLYGDDNTIYGTIRIIEMLKELMEDK